MKLSREWLIYSVIRVGIFAVALGVLLALSVTFVVAAIGAAIIGLCVSYIFFRRQRDAVAASIVRIRSTRQRDLDSDVENEAIDRSEG